MIKQFRIWLARRILGAHCPCYEMGGDAQVNYQQRCALKLRSHRDKKHDHSDTTP